jgi:hypothetical protein
MKSIAISDIPDSNNLQAFLEDFICEKDFSISIQYGSLFSHTPKLRALMDTLLDIYNVDVKDKNRLVLVSDELNNNAVEHGSGDC